VGKSFRRVVLVVALALAIGLIGAVVFLLEAKLRRERARIVGREQVGVFDILPTPDGSLLLEFYQNPYLSIRGQEPETSSRELTRELGGNFWIARSPRELVLAWTGGDQRPMPPVGGRVVRDLRGFPTIRDAFGFSPDGSKVLTRGHEETTVEVREMPSGRLRRVFPVKDARGGMFSPDDTRFVARTLEYEVGVYDVASARRIAPIGADPYVDLWDVFFIDPERVLSLERHALALWDATTGKSVRRREWSGPELWGLSDLTRDRRFLATVDKLTLRIWETLTLAPVFERKLADDVAELATKGESLRCVAFAPQEDAVFVGTNKGLILRVPIRLPERP
jgi:WD40 repeat protein